MTVASVPRRLAHAVAETWRGLHVDQRVAGIGAVLLIVSTFGIMTTSKGIIIVARKQTNTTFFPRNGTSAKA